MDRMLEQLSGYGADIEGAMGRFLQDEELYKTCFAAFLADEAFPQLGKSLAAGAYEAAFEYAHTLKGITGNMGLTPLYQIICSMVEQLRSKQNHDLQGCYAQVLRQLEQLRAMQE